MADRDSKYAEVDIRPSKTKDLFMNAAPNLISPSDDRTNPGGYSQPQGVFHPIAGYSENLHHLSAPIFSLHRGGEECVAC